MKSNLLSFVFLTQSTLSDFGTGFVSYDSVIAAEAAIEQMNGFQIGNKRLKVQHKRVHGAKANLPAQDTGAEDESGDHGEPQAGQEMPS